MKHCIDQLLHQPWMNNPIVTMFIGLFIFLELMFFYSVIAIVWHIAKDCYSGLQGYVKRIFIWLVTTV